MDISLVMKTADGHERPFPMSKSRMIIGREATSDVRIPVPRVANRHCELFFDEDQLKVADLGSGSGTLHNGKRINEAILAHADLLTVGPVTLEVRMREVGRPGAPVVDV